MFFPIEGAGNLLDNWKLPELPRYEIKVVDLSPDQAQGLLDEVLRNHNIDPSAAELTDGWRLLQFGEAKGIAGIMEWHEGVYHLLVYVPLFKLPPAELEIAHFYRLLLELNHHDTLAARFSINDDRLFVSLNRPIRGLDGPEIEDAIETVLNVADSLGQWLADSMLGAIRTAPVPAEELPSIPLKPKEVQALATVLAASDNHGRQVYRKMMEMWHQAGHSVRPATGGVGLYFSLGEKSTSVASLRPGVGQVPQLCVVGWENLRSGGYFAGADLDAFQSAVLEIASPRITESTAHILIDEQFDLDRATRFMRALIELVKEAHQPEVQPAPPWPDQLMPLGVELGAKTTARIIETLEPLEAWTQRFYARLIDGWHKAGGAVVCTRPGRIYLKLTTPEHEFRDLGPQSHTFNLAVLAGERGKRGPAIDVAWDLARGDYPYLDYATKAVEQFEQLVSSLPGYEQHGTVHRILLDEAYKSEDIERLLEAMLALHEASREDRQ